MEHPDPEGHGSAVQQFASASSYVSPQKKVLYMGDAEGVDVMGAAELGLVDGLEELGVMDGFEVVVATASLCVEVAVGLVV